MSMFSKQDYDLINLGVCIKNQADRLGIEHDGVPLEGVVVRIAERALSVVAEEPEGETITKLRDQIEEARIAWWSATEPGDSGLIYTDKIEDAMDDIWSAIGHADWVPVKQEGAPGD